MRTLDFLWFGAQNKLYCSIQHHLICFKSAAVQKNFNELRNLDLFNCEVTNIENYREKVFELLEGLMYLDGYDRNNKEQEDEEDEDGEDGEDVDGEDDDDDDDLDEDEDDGGW